jgi:hypothetical protein
MREHGVVDIIVNQTPGKTIERTDSLLLFIGEIAKAELKVKSADVRGCAQPSGCGSPTADG